MAIALLKAQNFRIYEELVCKPHPKLNLIVGKNAAGKTSLLEALFVACRGKSFREGQPGELTRSGAADWSIFLEDEHFGLQTRIGVGYRKKTITNRLNGHDVRLPEIVRQLPLQLIDPLAHRLLDDGPTYRRSFVDWGVFHVEHGFLSVWRRYQRALKQRNRSLKNKASDREVEAWNAELSEAGQAVAAFRSAHISETADRLGYWAEKLLGDSEVEMTWQQGWSGNLSLEDCLRQNIDQHRRMGSTTHGPHRAELKIGFAGNRAKGRISRGQQKMLITAMVLAQASVLVSRGIREPILLLDDFAAELAPEFQERLADSLLAYPGQKFVTSFELPQALYGKSSSVFHVEHGELQSDGTELH